MSDPSDTIPLEKRKYQSPQNGVGRVIPALHKEWMEPREWISYQIPPIDKDLRVLGAKDTWVERSSFILDDLEFMLSLPYHKFWSQVIYDENLRKSLARLLSCLPRQHDRWSPHPDPDIRGILSDLHRSTFLVFLRMSSYKESPKNFMGANTFGQIIYDNFVYDIPKILDICALFYVGNPLLVEKMVSNIFQCQPAYEQDLTRATGAISETITKCHENIDLVLQSPICSGTEETLVDLISYVTDIMVSLNYLLKAYPKAASLIHKNLEQQIPEIYQHGLVPTQLYLQNQKESGNISSESGDFLLMLINLSRHSSLLVVRALISNNFITPALEEIKKPNLDEDFLQSMMTIVSEPIFYADYSKHFQIQDDLDIFTQAGIHIDPFRLQYFQQGPAIVETETRKRRLTPPKTNVEFPILPIKDPSPLIETRIDNVQIESLISQVRDLLPDLGEGFILKCLQYYDFVPEKVINAILEENLPPHLIEEDRQKAREPVKPVDPPAELSNRINVFDGDEFDVNSKDSIDKSKIRLGKKKLGSKSANALLNNKKDLEGMRERFSALSMVSDVVYDVDYDDEYDDTYDDNAMGEKEPDALDELVERRPFVTPRVLAPRQLTNHQIEEDDEDDEEEEGDGGQRRNLDFARNPEEMRAEAERKRMAKYGARRPVAAAPPNRDVVGKPKGQGQDQSVLRNRARKNENKGKHIRNMADKKMSKGMF